MVDAPKRPSVWADLADAILPGAPLGRRAAAIRLVGRWFGLDPKRAEKALDRIFIGFLLLLCVGVVGAFVAVWLWVK